MAQKVNQIFQQNYGELVALMITDVALASTFETSIENQLISLRSAQTAIVQQSIDTIVGQISTVQSQYNTQVSQIRANTT